MTAWCVSPFTVRLKEILLALLWLSGLIWRQWGSKLLQFLSRIICIVRRENISSKLTENISSSDSSIFETNYLCYLSESSRNLWDDNSFCLSRFPSLNERPIRGEFPVTWPGPDQWETCLVIVLLERVKTISSSGNLGVSSADYLLGLDTRSRDHGGDGVEVDDELCRIFNLLTWIWNLQSWKL